MERIDMCTTCNYNFYKKVLINNIPHLQNKLGNGNLLLRCDTNGKNYKLAVDNENNSEFKCYRCPTCGKILK